MLTLTILPVFFWLFLWLAIAGNFIMILRILNLKEKISRIATLLHSNSHWTKEVIRGLEDQKTLIEKQKKIIDRERAEIKNLQKIILGFDPGYEFTMSN